MIIIIGNVTIFSRTNQSNKKDVGNEMRGWNRPFAYPLKLSTEFQGEITNALVCSYVSKRSLNFFLSLLILSEILL